MTEPEVEAIVSLRTEDSNVEIVVHYTAQDVRNIIENAALQECMGAMEGLPRHVHRATVVLRDPPPKATTRRRAK